MTTICVGCGGELLPAFAFCPRCGTARSAVPQPTSDKVEYEADRRQVTVVFADLTGFTSLAEGLDPETLRAFQNALFETMAQAIAHYDGFVEKFVGDAVMAVFGAPRAHEDDPLRALEAAQEMMQGVDRLSREWAARLGRAVTLHVGVHTGAVVAGSLVGSGAGAAYAVTGDTVNTAARLLGAAEPGTVLVSEATHLLVRDRFAFEPAAELALRGKAQPTLGHRLVGVRTDAASARGLAELGLAAPLVGRDDAIEHLLAAFDRMQRGQAQFVSVVGEAGTCKTRLLTELFARLEGDKRLAKTAVRRATCSVLGEPTYAAFGALFREAYRVDASDTLEVARNKLQEGLQALGVDADEADAVSQVVNVLLGIQEARQRDIEPEQLQRQITLGACALVERRLALQPVMLVVDDLQWADAASVELLGEVVDQLADRPLMLLVSQRPDARVLRTARAAQSTLSLAPLGDDETRALVGHLLGASADDSLGPVRDLVAGRAGGNPLFVEEIVRSLAGRGLLVRQAGGWVCEANCDAADVPATLFGLLLSRIDRLGPGDRHALQEAAVLGADFDGTLLQQIASEPRLIEESLRRLAAADLIRVAGSQRWRFTHALLHDVAYQNLLLARRTELHERAGRALEAALDGESRRPQRLAELEALGHHWSLSPDKVRGARYLLAAGDWARAVYANDDAIRHYERALRTLADVAVEAAAGEVEVEAAELDARERLADLLGRHGRRDDALAQYDLVRLAVERQRDMVRTARVLRKIGGLHWEAGERERAGACFIAGLEHLGEDGDPIERAHLIQEMGRLAFRAGDNATALTLAQRALAEVPDEPDEPDLERTRELALVRAQAFNTLGIALARLGRAPEAIEQIERSVRQAEASDLQLAEQVDEPQLLFPCYDGLATLYLDSGSMAQAEVYLEKARALCERAGLEPDALMVLPFLC